MTKVLLAWLSMFSHSYHGTSSRRTLGRFTGALLLALPLQAAAVDMLVSTLVDSPDLAVRGGLIVYSASISNNTSDIANGVALVFTLDAQTSFVSVSDSACAYVVGPHSVTCNYATVAGNVNGPGSAQIHNIDVTVRSLVGAGTTVNFNATVSTIDADTNPANDSLDQVTTIDNGSDLSLVLTGAPTSVPASSSLVYAAALNNAGPNTAGTTSASVTLSPNVTYLSASGSGWSCGAAGQVVTCTRATAAVGALPDITITAKVTGAFVGTISSIGMVTVSGSATDFNNANNSSTANTSVTNGTDLSITKSASAVILASGQAMTFILAPRNLGPFAADSVTVSDSLPAGFTNLSAAGTGWTCSVMGLDVSCTRATYAVGAANNITISATAPTVVALTPATNTASITAITPDGVPGNNSSGVNMNIVPEGVDLSIAKSKTSNPVAQGTNLASTIRVTNNGPRAATSGEVRVVETLPVGESFVALASGANWSCGAQVGQTVTCVYNASLAVGASSSNLALTTTANDVGTLTNNACAVYNGGVFSDPLSSNNCASASALSTSASSSVDLLLAKSADLATLDWNAPTITYTLTVSNSGPGSATGVVLTDPIPGYVAGNTVISASLTGGTSTATFSCTTGATVSCTQSGGSMGNGTTAVFTVTVTRPLLDSSAQPGNVWTNTASVYSINQGDLNTSNNSASAIVQVNPVTDIAVLNSITPTTTMAGTNATYVITVNNNGVSTATGVTLSDVFTFPSGTMTFISATPSSGSCAAFNAGTGTLNCNLGTLSSGSTATVTVVVRPDYMVAPPSPREITNTATVSTTTQESNVGNNSAANVLTVTQASLDVMVSNTHNVDPLGFVPASASPVFPDNVVTYRNAITNRGPSVATGLVLTYTMRPPIGKSITFIGDKVAATGQVYQNNCDNIGVQVTGPAIQTITCTFPGVKLAASNTTTDLYLDFKVDTQPNAAGDTYSSTVAIFANEPEAVTANNSANQTTVVKMRADLQLTKAARGFIGGVDSPATTLNFRQPFYYLVSLTNAGPGDSQASNLTDVLPAGLMLYAGGSSAPYNSAPYNTGQVWNTNNGTPTSGSCTGTSTISCAIGLLESGKTALIRIPVVSVSTYFANVTNCASATTSEVDPNASNNNNVCSAAVAQQRSSIAGTVYIDANNDGVKAGGESGIANVLLRLDGTDIYGNTVTNLTATTDGSGNYSFTNLTPGTYTITETQPVGYQDGVETAGTAGGAATGSSGDTISGISLPANTAATGYLFGESIAMNGVCGSANGSTIPYSPAVNLCATGSASGVTSGSGRYSWTCSGSSAGTSASCNANWPAVGSGRGTTSVSGNGWAFAPPGNGSLETGGFIPVNGHPKSPPSLPPGFSFPNGLFEFVLTGGTVGSAATVTITYPSALPAGTVYWKYGPTPAGNNCTGIACAAAHWYSFPAVISGNTATLIITDGGLGDDDLNANGLIVDAGGPGIPVAVPGGGITGVATLTEWGTLLLSVFTLGAGMAYVRRRHLTTNR